MNQCNDEIDTELIENPFMHSKKWKYTLSGRFLRELVKDVTGHFEVVPRDAEGSYYRVLGKAEGH